MRKTPVLLILVLIVLGLIAVVKYLQTPADILQSQVTTEDKTKDCGSEIDKAGAAHTLNKECFAEAFKTCAPAKINQESFPPDNVPSIKTSIRVEGQTDKGCRIQVSVHNALAFPENNIYYCYKAEKGIADDTLSKDHLIISECDNNKRIVF